MKQTLTICTLLIGFVPLTYSQNTVAKIEYAEAETDFQAENYVESLAHLETVKEMLGSTNAKVMYLEILSLFKTISIKRNTLEDYYKFENLTNLSNTYISNFENSAPIEKIKDVYEINKACKSSAILVNDLIEGQKQKEVKNIENALSYFMKACDAGNPEACKNISNIYAYENQYKDEKKYKFHLEKAVKLGGFSAKHNKANSLLDGSLGYTKDINEAKSLFEQNITDGYNFSKLGLGILYTREEKNKVLAKQNFLEVYELGFTYAIVELFKYDYDSFQEYKVEIYDELKVYIELYPKNYYYHQLMEIALRLDKQYAKAMKHIIIAANLGSPQSNDYLSQIYENSDYSKTFNVKKDKSVAKSYALKACELDIKYCK